MNRVDKDTLRDSSVLLTKMYMENNDGAPAPEVAESVLKYVSDTCVKYHVVKDENGRKCCGCPFANYEIIRGTVNEMNRVCPFGDGDYYPWAWTLDKIANTMVWSSHFKARGGTKND